MHIDACSSYLYVYIFIYFFIYVCVCTYKISVGLGLFQHIRIKGSLPTTVPEGKSKAYPPAPFPPICIFISAVHITVCHIAGELRNTQSALGEGSGHIGPDQTPEFSVCVVRSVLSDEEIHLLFYCSWSGKFVFCHPFSNLYLPSRK